MLLWRIARRRYALDRTGIGARQSGGRWNRPGTAVIYAGLTIALTALEKFVHVAGIVPADLVLVRIDVPDGASVEQPKLADLPADWHVTPPPPSSMAFGTTWAQANRSLVLYVPSALVREERNALLNPAHPEFSGVTMAVARAFAYDSRMYVPRRTP